MADPWWAIAITFLHDAFMAVWIGGTATLAWSVLPAAQAMSESEEGREFVSQVQRRLNSLLYIAVGGLWITGVVMARHSNIGLVQFDTPAATLLVLKHLLVLLMIAVAFIRAIGGRQALNPLSAPRRQLMLLLVNLGLGLIVLGLSAVLAAQQG